MNTAITTSVTATYTTTTVANPVGTTSPATVRRVSERRDQCLAEMDPNLLLPRGPNMSHIVCDWTRPGCILPAVMEHAGFVLKKVNKGELGPGENLGNLLSVRGVVTLERALALIARDGVGETNKEFDVHGFLSHLMNVLNNIIEEDPNERERLRFLMESCSVLRQDINTASSSSAVVAPTTTVTSTGTVTSPRANAGAGAVSGRPVGQGDRVYEPVSSLLLERRILDKVERSKAETVYEVLELCSFLNGLTEGSLTAPIVKCAIGKLYGFLRDVNIRRASADYLMLLNQLRSFIAKLESGGILRHDPGTRSFTHFVGTLVDRYALRHSYGSARVSVRTDSPPAPIPSWNRELNLNRAGRERDGGIPQGSVTMRREAERLIKDLSVPKPRTEKDAAGILEKVIEYREIVLENPVFVSALLVLLLKTINNHEKTRAPLAPRTKTLMNHVLVMLGGWKPYESYTLGTHTMIREARERLLHMETPPEPVHPNATKEELLDYAERAHILTPVMLASYIHTLRAASFTQYEDVNRIVLSRIMASESSGRLKELLESSRNLARALYNCLALVISCGGEEGRKAGRLSRRLFDQPEDDDQASGRERGATPSEKLLSTQYYQVPKELTLDMGVRRGSLEERSHSGREAQLSELHAHVQGAKGRKDDSSESNRHGSRRDSGSHAHSRRASRGSESGDQRASTPPPIPLASNLDRQNRERGARRQGIFRPIWHVPPQEQMSTSEGIVEHTPIRHVSIPLVPPQEQMSTSEDVVRSTRQRAGSLPLRAQHSQHSEPEYQYNQEHAEWRTDFSMRRRDSGSHAHSRRASRGSESGDQRASTPPPIPLASNVDRQNMERGARRQGIFRPIWHVPPQEQMSNSEDVVRSTRQRAGSLPLRAQHSQHSEPEYQYNQEHTEWRTDFSMRRRDSGSHAHSRRASRGSESGDQRASTPQPIPLAPNMDRQNMERGARRQGIFRPIWRVPPQEQMSTSEDVVRPIPIRHVSIPLVAPQEQMSASEDVVRSTRQRAGSLPLRAQHSQHSEPEYQYNQEHTEWRTDSSMRRRDSGSHAHSRRASRGSESGDQRASTPPPIPLAPNMDRQNMERGARRQGILRPTWRVPSQEQMSTSKDVVRPIPIRPGVVPLVPPREQMSTSEDVVRPTPQRGLLPLRVRQAHCPAPEYQYDQEDPRWRTDSSVRRRDSVASASSNLRLDRVTEYKPPSVIFTARQNGDVAAIPKDEAERNGILRNTQYSYVYRYIDVQARSGSGTELKLFKLKVFDSNNFLREDPWRASAGAVRSEVLSIPDRNSQVTRRVFTRFNTFSFEGLINQNRGSVREARGAEGGERNRRDLEDTDWRSLGGSYV